MSAPARGQAVTTLFYMVPERDNIIAGSQALLFTHTTHTKTMQHSWCRERMLGDPRRWTSNVLDLLKPGRGSYLQHSKHACFASRPFGDNTHTIGSRSVRSGVAAAASPPLLALPYAAHSRTRERTQSPSRRPFTARRAPMRPRARLRLPARRPAVRGRGRFACSTRRSRRNPAGPARDTRPQ